MPIARDDALLNETWDVNEFLAKLVEIEERDPRILLVPPREGYRKQFDSEADLQRAYLGCIRRRSNEFPKNHPARFALRGFSFVARYLGIAAK